jgi:signal transduction histidine kinase
MEKEVEVSGIDFYSDPWRIEEIFRNLVSNAIKYRKMDTSKHLIKIKVETTDATARIIFTDYGIGISQTDQSKIFDMFYRASARSIGSGLGLYIVRNAVEKLGGRVGVESIPDQYTTFKIELFNYKTI